jgi:hypothetical protein
MRFSRYGRLLSGFVLASFAMFGQAQDQPGQQHVGRVIDWSYHHVIMSGGLAGADLDGAKSEPRVLFHLAERNFHQASARFARQQVERDRRHPGRPLRPQTQKLQIDWSVPLGTGIVAPNMFPAKFSFDINAAPSCTADYVVFGLNVAGAAGQASLLGFKPTLPRHRRTLRYGHRQCELGI